MPCEFPRLFYSTKASIVRHYKFSNEFERFLSAIKGATVPPKLSSFLLPPQEGILGHSCKQVTSIFFVIRNKNSFFVATRWERSKWLKISLASPFLSLHFCQVEEHCLYLEDHMCWRNYIFSLFYIPTQINSNE